MTLAKLPLNVKNLLKEYVGEFRLRELPASFTQRTSTGLHFTTQGVPIIYKHRDTGETLKVDTYPWKSAHKQQSVVVASGRSLQEPVIIVPAQRGSTELKIWKGEKSGVDDDGVPCPIYKEFNRSKFSELAGRHVSMMPSSPIVRDDKRDVTLCLCGRNVPEGEMVLCEECDTWQHIVCYYPNELLPAAHFCEDCGSKYLDAKRNAKRQKLEPKSALPNYNVSNVMKAQPSDRSVAQAIFNERHHPASPDLGSPGIPNVVATIGEQKSRSCDEPVTFISSKKTARDNFETGQVITTKINAAAVVGERQQTALGAENSEAPIMDLVSDTEADYVKVKAKAKIEPDDNQSLENASTLSSQCITTAASSVTDVCAFPPIPNNLVTATSTTPSMASQRACSSHPPLGESAALQLVNNATTFVFIDSQNRELRRRTFDDLGGRLNVGTLFGQAIRADLIDKFDESAILSVSIRGFDETFEIPKYDKPDFARLMQRIQAAGLCMVEVRLS